MSFNIYYSKKKNPSEPYSLDNVSHVQEVFDDKVKAVKRYWQLFYKDDMSIWGLHVVGYRPGEIYNESHLQLEEAFMRHAEKTKLQDICEIKKNFKDADFWMVRSHSDTGIGKPVKEYKEDYIGLRIRDSYIDKMNADFLYFCMMNLFNRGVWKYYASGSTELQHLPIAAVKMFELGFMDE